MPDPGTILGTLAALGGAGAAVAFINAGRRPPPDPEPSKLDILMAEWPERIAPAVKLDGSRLQDIRGNDWGWTAGLQLRPGQTKAEAIKALPAINSALQVRPRAARIEEHPERADMALLRIVERDPFAEPIPWPGPSIHSILDPINWGLFETGQHVKARVAYQHIVIGGETGAGKSSIINLLAGNLAAARDVVVWGVDFKGGVELKPWLPTLGRLATTPQEARDLYADAVDLIDQREREIAGHGRLWTPTPATPAVVILVDEQAEFAQSDDKTLKLGEKQNTVARTGRAMAVTQVVAVQRTIQTEIGSPVVRQQATIKVCMRVEEPEEADIIFGDGARKNGWAPDELTLDGSFLIRVKKQGLSIPRPARAYWTGDGKVREVAAEYAGRQPRIEARGSATARTYEEPEAPTTGGKGAGRARVQRSL